MDLFDYFCHILLKDGSSLVTINNDVENKSSKSQNGLLSLVWAGFLFMSMAIRAAWHIVYH